MFEIGNSLREARLRQQLEFPQVEQATKIRGKYLRALEDEQFDILPSQTYVKGFLRNYAEYLGLDGQLYVDEYNSRYVIGEEGADQPFRARRREAPRARTRAHRQFEKSVVLLALGAIVAIAALVFAAFKFSGSPHSQKIANLGTGKTPTGSTSGAAAASGLVIRAVRGPLTLEIHRGGHVGQHLPALEEHVVGSSVNYGPYPQHHAELRQKHHGPDAAGEADDDRLRDFLD